MISMRKPKRTPNRKRSSSLDTPDFRSAWVPFAKQHFLPEFDALNLEFWIDELEDVRAPARAVAKKIAETYDHYAKIVESVFQSDMSLIAMREAGTFSDEEMARHSRLLSRLMRTYRSYQRVELENLPERYLLFIKESWNEWPALKQELLGLLSRMRDAWDREHHSPHDDHYIG